MPPKVLIPDLCHLIPDVRTRCGLRFRIHVKNFSNAASVHGKGDTQYTGAGILARFAFDETQAAPLYLDASIRSGKVKTDFSGNLYDGFGRAAAYNAKSTYVSAHVGAGYVINLTEQSKLDIYGQ
ncbi:hypothetical protein AGMMS49545_10260 [Betaproteobacteria bacterium]|nr:hypothetical protein AGMMS49545_10260 [Betaproteobacteria bacterium]GHU44316.1 hypothetical protein AGMMS50289_12340 [Betaproteobacteria bacterium]